MSADRRLTVFAKNLRKRATNAENLLWQYLRLKQVKGVKFRRQQPIEGYIVDFVSFEKKIVIELDGGQHAINKQADINRDRWLRSRGYKVLRFWNNDVLSNIEGILEVVKRNW